VRPVDLFQDAVSVFESWPNGKESTRFPVCERLSMNNKTHTFAAA